MRSDDLYLIEDVESALVDPLDQLLQTEDTTPPDPEVMLVQLQDANALNRLAAVRAFAALTEPRAIPHLIKALDDTCPNIRTAAAYALGRNVSHQAVDVLIECLRHDQNDNVRKAVAWALGNYSDRRSIQPLIEALRRDIAPVRLWAASSLGNTAVVDYETVIGAVPSLIEALRRDPEADVRSNCAWSLGQLCRPLPANIVYATVIDALIEALVEDEDMSVREDAKASLLQVGDARALQMIETLQQDGLLW
ncbi:HEAT repeat domain-containing protein [Synechococcus elongatus IITB4]|uniref:HEAT repeat domain-containing protein n=1 Tax=Synechococcus elongatus TaxID=32046 RepID=UPI0030D528E6